MKKIYYFFNGCVIVFWSCVKDLFTGAFVESFKKLIEDIVETGKDETR